MEHQASRRVGPAVEPPGKTLRMPWLIAVVGYAIEVGMAYLSRGGMTW